MLKSSSSPRSGSPKRWGGGGGSPILPTRSHLGRGIIVGTSQGLKGSPLPSRPPHLPHPRSRSLDTALDKASDSTTPSSMAESHGGSVAGSLTDSTMPDSVATDSVTDFMAASDTDASDSGIFNRYSAKQSRGSDRKKSHPSGLSTAKEVVSETNVNNCLDDKSNFRRISKGGLGSKENIRSSGRLKPKNTKNVTDLSSSCEKDKPKRDHKSASKLPSTRSEEISKASKVKAAADEIAAHSEKSNDNLLFKDKGNNSVEVDPYSNFYNRRLKPKITSVAASNVHKLPIVDKEDGVAIPLQDTDILKKGRSLQGYSKQNPYISPLISSLNKRETSPISSQSSSPALSTSSPLRSPSLISSSSHYKKKEPAFTFPRQSPQSSTATDNSKQEVNVPTVSSKFKSSIPSSSKPSYRSSLIRAFPQNTVSQIVKVPSPTDRFSEHRKIYSSPFDAPRHKKKPVEEIDLHKEGSHIDLVASCEKYLQEEKLNNESDSDDDLTLASTRRSSVSSSASSSSRRRRRLSSIPLEDDLTITEEDFTSAASNSPAKSDTSHEMAIFSAIAALSRAGCPREDRDDSSSTGDYEGCSEVTDATKTRSSTLTGNQSAKQPPSSSMSAKKKFFVPSSPLPQLKRPPTTNTPDEAKTSDELKTSTSSSQLVNLNNSRSSSATIPCSSDSAAAATTTTLPSASLLDKCVNRVKTFIKK